MREKQVFLGVFRSIGSNTNAVAYSEEAAEIRVRIRGDHLFSDARSTTEHARVYLAADKRRENENVHGL